MIFGSSLSQSVLLKGLGRLNFSVLIGVQEAGGGGFRENSVLYLLGSVDKWWSKKMVPSLEWRGEEIMGLLDEKVGQRNPKVKLPFFLSIKPNKVEWLGFRVSYHDALTHISNWLKSGLVVHYS